VGPVLCEERATIRAMPRRDGTLKAREFLFYTEDQAMARLTTAIPRPNRRVMWTILQLYYDDPQVHFELQPQGARSQVELGLHFEADVETNERRAQLVAAHAPALLEVLGPEWEMEEWTASWRRLHRVFPFERLTAELGRQIAEQFAALVTTVAPMIDDIEAIRPIAVTPGNQGAVSSRHRPRARAGRR
jgi:hypothetical protein